MNLHFTISEFNISGEHIPEEVADKILEHHIVPMVVVREQMGEAVWPSLKSGYRPFWWEKKYGRSGKSQHCFGEQESGEFDPGAKGAVDWTADDLDRLEELIMELTPYTRIARYKNFIHCDYKAQDGKRYYFKSGDDSKWQFIKHL